MNPPKTRPALPNPLSGPPARCYTFVVVEPPDPLLPPKYEGGPDPVWGVGLCIVGLLVMGIGGAATWHWTFNIGAGVLLLGLVVFLAAVALSWNAQRKLAAGKLATGKLATGKLATGKLATGKLVAANIPGAGTDGGTDDAARA